MERTIDESDATIEVRDVRNGDVLTGYQSTDGSNWTEVGTARLAGLSDTAQVGLFVTSPSAEQSTGTGSALQRHLQQISPMTAGLAVQATVGIGTLPIGPWQGLGVLALWALTALTAGGLLHRSRDA
jgi:hypothetical protein